MKSIISSFIAALSINVFHIYAWSKNSNKKINLRNYKTYLIIFLLTILIVLNYFFVDSLIKVTTATCLLIIANKLIIKEDINRSIITTLISQFIIMISEILWAVIFLSIVKTDNVDYITENYFGQILINFVIAFIAFIIVNIKYVRKFANFIIKITDKVKTYELAILILLIVIIINVVFGTIYYNNNISQIIILNTLLVLIYVFVILKLVKVKNEYQKVSEKYDTTLSSLKEYENILDKYRISNHENKNQLLTIRNMINKKEKGLKKYLDTIIDTAIKDNEKLSFKTSVIPSGGLRAVIYTKMLLMEEKNIDVKLLVDKKVRTIELIKLGDELLLDICKIIGVYLDNSIDAVEDLDKKEVLIEMFIDENKLNISISNNYSGNLEIDKFEQMGYSTKGKGHGYGLCMVKEVLNNNKKLSNKKSINNDVFTQTLIITL